MGQSLHGFGGIAESIVLEMGVSKEISLLRVCVCFYGSVYSSLISMDSLLQSDTMAEEMGRSQKLTSADYVYDQGLNIPSVETGLCRSYLC
jgi:hypothetical protein